MSDQPEFDPHLPRLSSQMCPPLPERKHSGLGIASFILALVLGVIIFLLFCVAGYAEARAPGGLDDNPPQAALIGFGILGALAINLCGLTLGIVGLASPNRRKGFAIAGVTINACIIVGTVGLIAIGLSIR